jgi:hypothetical protein
VLSWKTNIQNFIYHRKYCFVSYTTWICSSLFLIVRWQFVTKLIYTGGTGRFFGKQFLIQLGNVFTTKTFMVNVNSIIQWKLSHNELN